MKNRFLRRPEIPVSLLLILLCFFTGIGRIVYLLVRVQPQSQILLYGLGVVVLVVLLMQLDRLLHLGVAPFSDVVATGGVMLLFLLALYGAFNVVHLLGIGIYQFVFSDLPTRSTRTAGIVVAGIAAAGLFFFRLRARATYGLTEIAFAAWLGFHQLPAATVATLNFETSKSLAPVLLSGCVYLAVRGMDNMHQGYKRDGVINAFRRFHKLTADRLQRENRTTGGAS